MASARAVSSRLNLVIFISLKYHDINLAITAPGFQTSVKKVRVTPEIAARIRRGEEVSPEEIEAAARKADLNIEAEGAGESGGLSHGRLRGVIEERDDRHLINAEKNKVEVVNEWLPESVTKPTKRKRGQK